MIGGTSHSFHDKISYLYELQRFLYLGNMTTVASRIEIKLKTAFSPAELDVVDESHLHAGHAGARPQGESHFRVRIVAEAFRGQSRVVRQRMIYKELADELTTDIHALALDVQAPDEK